nr:hypothetical protein BaRGS_011197 [Batillaria attramentaria]
MRQVKSYFNVGMENVLEVASDMAEYGKGEEKHVRKLQNIMLSYARMERDLERFMAATLEVLDEAGDTCESGTLESMLDEKVEQHGQDSNDASLKQHEKYVELEQKIWDSQHPDAAPCSLGASAPLFEDDIEMTQENMNTKCPYTLQEMVNPVRNKICKHSYDKTGIMEYLKKRGKKALCPVIGCGNKKPITSSDLEDNKDLRSLICCIDLDSEK